MATVLLVAVLAGLRPRRLTYPVAGGMAMSLLFLLPLAAHDLATRKRLHPTTLIGGLALVAIRLTAVFVIAPSSFGQSVMKWFA